MEKKGFTKVEMLFTTISLPSVEDGRPEVCEEREIKAYDSEKGEWLQITTENSGELASSPLRKCLSELLEITDRNNLPGINKSGTAEVETPRKYRVTLRVELVGEDSEVKIGVEQSDPDLQCYKSIHPRELKKIKDSDAAAAHMHTLVGRVQERMGGERRDITYLVEKLVFSTIDELIDREVSDFRAQKIKEGLRLDQMRSVVHEFASDASRKKLKRFLPEACSKIRESLEASNDWGEGVKDALMSTLTLIEETATDAEILSFLVNLHVERLKGETGATGSEEDEGEDEVVYERRGTVGGNLG